MFKVIRNQSYDFIGESYASKYPNLHKYPATMLPQIGIKILEELGIKKGKLLDPYCGSASSFISAIDKGINNLEGYDINPLAILITRVKFTEVSVKLLEKTAQDIRNEIFEIMKNKYSLNDVKLPDSKNILFWFSKNVLINLSIIRQVVNSLKNKAIKDFFWLPLSETIRECSYTRNNEFKLYKMKEDAVLNFNPDVFGVFFDKVGRNIKIYKNYYLPKIGNSKVKTYCKPFDYNKKSYDVVLTSPPYGDSRTTVAYGQFSTFSNEWMGFNDARSLDRNAMGGKRTDKLYQTGLMEEYIKKIDSLSRLRALEISSFYFDLEDSIQKVSDSLKRGGKAIYVVGNRTVKGFRLPTDQFIAEQFEINKCKHLVTYERLLSNKAMPLKNSPTNKSGQLMDTMNYEYIVVCEKNKC